jgi:hypothetical protein
MAVQRMAARTLVIGLGDFTKDILDQVYDQFAAAQALAHLRLLWLRSNDEFFPAPPALPDCGALPDQPEFYVINRPVKDALSSLYYSVDETRIWCAPHWKRWTWGELRSNRVYGKLWIQEQLPTIEKALDGLLATAETEQTADAAALTRSALSVFVIAPLVDVFASGAWLDVAYLAQQHFPPKSTNDVRVSGILLLPTPDQVLDDGGAGGEDRGLIDAITYAALRELQPLLQVPSFFNNHHRLQPINVKNAAPFVSGDCFVLGGSRNEQDDPNQPLRAAAVIDHCVKLIYYTARAVPETPAVVEARRGTLSDAPVEAIFPRIPYYQITDVNGVASFGMYQHADAPHEGDREHTAVLFALVDQLLGAAQGARARSEEQTNAAERVAHGLQELFRSTQGKINDPRRERELLAPFAERTRVLSPDEQDAQYTDAVRRLTDYEQLWLAGYHDLIADAGDDLTQRVESLAHAEDTLTLVKQSLNLIRAQLERRERDAQTAYADKLEQTQAVIHRLQVDRARRRAFSLTNRWQAGRESGALSRSWMLLALLYGLPALLVITVLFFSFNARWMDLPRLLLALGGAGAALIYARRARPDPALQEVIRSQQEQLQREQISLIDLRQQHAFWRDVLDLFNRLRIDEVGAAEIDALHASAMALRQQLDGRLNASDSRDDAPQREVEREWGRMRQPVWSILTAWTATARSVETLEQTLRAFAIDKRLIRVDDSTLRAAVNQLASARVRAACLLQPDDQHISFPAHLHGLNRAPSGSGIVIRSGFVNVKTGDFLPIPEAKFSGNAAASTLTIADLPQPLDQYRAAAIRVRGGIPLAALADVPAWYRSYNARGEFLPDAPDATRVRQRAFFHPTRAGLASPDLIRQGSNPMPFPYLTLAAAMLRHNRRADVWKSLARIYALQPVAAPANVSGDDLRVPLNLDELCNAIHERLHHTDKELVDAPKIVLPPRPLRRDVEAAVEDDDFAVGEARHEQVMIQALEDFVTMRARSIPAETIADWEAWVFDLLDNQLRERPDKPAAQEQRRYLIRFAYDLLQQIEGKPAALRKTT